jgi:hypothetical protein
VRMLKSFYDAVHRLWGQYEVNASNRQGARVSDSQLLHFSKQPLGAVESLDRGLHPHRCWEEPAMVRADSWFEKHGAGHRGLPRLAAGNRSRNVTREPDRNERERPGTALRNRAAGTKRERPCGSAEGTCLGRSAVAEAATNTAPVAGHNRTHTKTRWDKR